MAATFIPSRSEDNMANITRRALLHTTTAIAAGAALAAMRRTTRH
jgi:hypothetical protein